MPRVMDRRIMDASEPLDASEASVRDNTYMLHNQLAMLSVRPCGAANKQQRYPFKRINKRLRRKKK
jgi:hypothetical protein